jgi:hypothetical protein
MGEETQVTQNEFNEEEVKKVAIEKAVNYLKENETIIILERIAYKSNEIDIVAERLSKFYVSLRRGLYNTDITFYKNSLYGYSTEDLLVTDITLATPGYGYRVKMGLPNRVNILEIQFELNDSKLLEKEAYNEEKAYEQTIIGIADALKKLANKLCEKANETNNEEEEENDS